MENVKYSLFLSQELSDFFEIMKEKYDLILIDTPAYKDGIDAFVLSKFIRPFLVLHSTNDEMECLSEVESELAVLDCSLCKYVR